MTPHAVVKCVLTSSMSPNTVLLKRCPASERFYTDVKIVQEVGVIYGRQIYAKITESCFDDTKFDQTAHCEIGECEFQFFPIFILNLKLQFCRLGTTHRVL